MVHYVGLDVSLKHTSICVVNQAGSVVREGVVDSDPGAIAAFVRSNAREVGRIGLETGPTAKANRETTDYLLSGLNSVSTAFITGILGFRTQ